MFESGSFADIEMFGFISQANPKLLTTSSINCIIWVFNVANANFNIQFQKMQKY